MLAAASSTIARMLLVPEVMITGSAPSATKPIEAGRGEAWRRQGDDLLLHQRGEDQARRMRRARADAEIQFLPADAFQHAGLRHLRMLSATPGCAAWNSRQRRQRGLGDMRGAAERQAPILHAGRGAHLAQPGLHLGDRAAGMRQKRLAFPASG